jgi:hypothetical protein
MTPHALASARDTTKTRIGREGLIMTSRYISLFIISKKTLEKSINKEKKPLTSEASWFATPPRH